MGWLSWLQTRVRLFRKGGRWSIGWLKLNLNAREVMEEGRKSTDRSKLVPRTRVETKGGRVGGRGSMKSWEKRTVTAELGISSMVLTMTFCGASVVE